MDPLQQAAQLAEGVTCWSSADRLNVSIGLMYALCNLAVELGAVAGFCVPRPQLLRRWLQVGRLCAGFGSSGGLRWLDVKEHLWHSSVPLPLLARCACC